MNARIESSDIARLVSGEKQIAQIVEQLRKTDKDFDREYVQWEKEKKSEKNPEKQAQTRSKNNNTPQKE